MKEIKIGEYIKYNGTKRPSLTCGDTYQIQKIRKHQWTTTAFVTVLDVNFLIDWPDAQFYVCNDSGWDRWYPAKEFDLSILTQKDVVDNTKTSTSNSKWMSAFLDIYEEQFDDDYCSETQQVLEDLAYAAGYTIKTERTFKLVKRV